MRRFHHDLLIAQPERLPDLLRAAIRYARANEAVLGLQVWEFAWAALGELARREEEDFFS